MKLSKYIIYSFASFALFLGMQTISLARNCNSPGYPVGSYKDTCINCYINGSTLKALCKNTPISSIYNKAEINLANCDPKELQNIGVQNIRGVLTCVVSSNHFQGKKHK